MKILANAKIKAFFDWILCSILIFTAGMILFAALLGNRQRLMAFCLPLCPLGMGLMILAGFYRYFKEQNETMEQAVKQIPSHVQLSHSSSALHSRTSTGNNNIRNRDQYDTGPLR